MKRLICLASVFLIAAGTAGCSKSGAQVDHNDPTKVVQAIFDAAKGKDHTALSGLCDPQGKNDGDTRRICELTQGHKKWEEFVQYFADGQLKGGAQIDGDQAKVPFLFGPGGKKSEEMKLVKRDDKWYLSSF